MTNTLELNIFAKVPKSKF